MNDAMLKAIMNNKGVKKMLGQMELAAQYLMTFAQVYMEGYEDEDGNKHPPDRELFMDNFERILKKLDRLEKEIEEIKSKLS